jgi:23S rRNA pseudouridine1911/1915/1917 synthase
MIQDQRAFKITVNAPDGGKRLDFFISAVLPDCSRSFAAELIRTGKVRVCDGAKKAGYRVRIGDEISAVIPPPVMTAYGPESIPLHILHEDAAIVVINKQPGLVVHPSPGHASGTLVNALLYHCPGIEAIGGELRPGIVHRLDRDTSGTMVIAKNAIAMKHLADQFKSRRVQKDYLALVYDVVKADRGTVSLPIGRHPVDRKRMSTRSRKTRTAETDWFVEERLNRSTLLRVQIRTGRTHQIRVHCAAIQHPIVGDPVYGGRKKNARTDGLPPQVQVLIRSAGRQMLHAWRLEFIHPVTEIPVQFEAPLPPDMVAVIDTLRSGIVIGKDSGLTVQTSPCRDFSNDDS